MGDLVDLLGLGQPSVSKHLRVLRDVDLVRVHREGRQMLYRTNAEAIRPLHEWAGGFKQYRRHQLQRKRSTLLEISGPLMMSYSGNTPMAG